MERKIDISRFSKCSKKFVYKEKNIKFLHCGAITFKSKNSKSWWVNRFKSNDLYPGRTLIHKYASELNIISLSEVLWDHSNDQIIKKIINKLKTLFNQKKEKNIINKYYNLDVSSYFSKSLFFLCPEDILGVVPQFCFHAMRAGLIIIGTSSRPFESLGFKDRENYISVGPNWEKKAIKKALKVCEELNEKQFLRIRKNSILLQEKLINDTQKQICEILY